jgi:molybdopterin converting factor small subunit
MRVQVRVHGMLTAAVDDPESPIVVELPKGTDICGLVELLGERSPLFDPRNAIAVLDGVKVELSRTLREGDEVDLHVLFGGG